MSTATDSWRGASIKVVGVGGAGSNAVDRMIQVGIPGVEFVAANTDAQALARSEASCKVVLGETLTKGLGAGGDPVVGTEAAERTRERLSKVLRGADMVFIAAGMGGGTGSGASPVVARIAREQGALTIAVVTRPFTFEGGRREGVAEQGIHRLQQEVDTLVVVSNDRLLDIVNERVSLDIAFRIADEVLRQGIQGVSELVTRPGLINLDFADVRSIMQGAGGALVSIGHGEGEDKALEAAQIALGSPLLDIESVKGADGLLVNITGGQDLTLAEIDSAMKMISGAALPGAEIIFGTVIDPKMDNRVQITLIATGLGVERVSAVPETAQSTETAFSPAMVFGADSGRQDGRLAETTPAFLRSTAKTGASWRR
ncbi:MAG: cell division protein FtsZ [Anaerolineae bacterium]|nr:cell division protein FtsZ [Anaerolineae bacterium]